MLDSLVILQSVEKLLTGASSSLLSITRRQRLKIIKTSGCSAEGRIRSALFSSLESKYFLSQLKVKLVWKGESNQSLLFFEVKLANYHFEGVSLKKKLNCNSVSRQADILTGTLVLDAKALLTSVKKYPNDCTACHSYTLILLAKTGCPKTPPLSAEFVMHWIHPVTVHSVLYLLNLLLLPFQ